MALLNSPSLPLPPDPAQWRTIVVAQPLDFQGRYDASQIQRLRLTTDAGKDLPLMVRRGKWQLRWADGWTTAGAHWLQIQGYDRAGALVAQQFFYFSVCAAAVTASQLWYLRLHQDTWFKASSRDAIQLTPDQKVRLRAGQHLLVLRYALAPAYYQLHLAQPIDPVGHLGYVAASAASLLQGDTVHQCAPLDPLDLNPFDVDPVGAAGPKLSSDALPVDLQPRREFCFPNVASQSSSARPAQLQVRRTTPLKSRLTDAAHLSPRQQQQLIQGQCFPLSRYARCDDHWRVSLPTTDLPEDSFVAAADVQLAVSASPLPGEEHMHWQCFDVDPAALTLEILQTTPIKRQPLPSDQLPLTAKFTLEAGQCYRLQHYAFQQCDHSAVAHGGGEHVAGHAQGTHLYVKLRSTAPLPAGYLDMSQVQLRRGARRLYCRAPQVELNLPVLGTTHPQSPGDWPQLNLRAIAAVLVYYQRFTTVTAQLIASLLQWCFEQFGPGAQTDVTCLVALLESFDCQVETRQDWTHEDLRLRLQQGQPILLMGHFTPSHHLVVLCGYTATGWLVADPWGDATTGYICRNGDRCLYPLDYWQAMVGPEGMITAMAVRLMNA